MSRGYAGLLLAGTLALGACAAQTPVAIDAAAEEQAIRAVSARWLELEKADDAAGVAALFTEDGIAYREDTDPISGPAAYRAYLERSFAENPSEVVDWSTDFVDVAASGDLAVEHGTWSSRGAGAGGEGEDEGRYLTVYRKVNGEWKVAADMSLGTRKAAPAAVARAQ